MSLTFAVTIHCDACKARGKARGYLTSHTYSLPGIAQQQTHATLVFYPKGWKHAPCVDFCPKCLKKRAAAIAKAGEPPETNWV